MQSFSACIQKYLRDTGERPTQDASARSPDILLLQGVIVYLLLHGDDQLLQVGQELFHDSAGYTGQSQQSRGDRPS